MPAILHLADLLAADVPLASTATAQFVCEYARRRVCSYRPSIGLPGQPELWNTNRLEVAAAWLEAARRVTDDGFLRRDPSMVAKAGLATRNAAIIYSYVPMARLDDRRALMRVVNSLSEVANLSSDRGSAVHLAIVASLDAMVTDDFQWTEVARASAMAYAFRRASDRSSLVGSVLASRTALTVAGKPLIKLCMEEFLELCPLTREHGTDRFSDSLSMIYDVATAALV